MEMVADVPVLILDRLDSKGVIVDKCSIRLNSDQGFMSRVFAAKSSAGDLLISVVEDPFDEQVKQRVHEKMFGISGFLKIRGFPVAEFVTYGDLPEGGYFFVQKRLEGARCGTRLVEDGLTFNRFDCQDSEDIQRQIKALLARIHHIPIRGFGTICFKDGSLVGMYDSWIGFLKNESGVWLDNVFAKESDKSRFPDSDKRSLQKDLDLFFEKFKDRLSIGQGRLIHGDMIHPGNVLERGGRISGLVDFEFALSGDPAWEFAFIHDLPFDDYFDERAKLGEEIDSEEFLGRVELYSVLWYLWGANVHAKGQYPEIKEFLYRGFRSKLDSTMNG